MANTCEKLLTEREAAARIAMKVATLRRWRWEGKGLPFLKIGGAVRYDPRDIEEFIQRARRASTSDDGGVQ